MAKTLKKSRENKGKQGGKRVTNDTENITPGAAGAPGVTASEIAQLRNVHVVTVRQWTRDGCPCTKRGGLNYYDPAAVATWLSTRGKTGKVGRPATKTSAGLDKAKLRKENALADQHELKVQKLRRDLVPAEEVRKHWGEISVSIRSSFAQLGATIAPGLEGLPAADIQKVIDSRVSSILDSLAKTNGMPPVVLDEPGAGGEAAPQ